MSDDLYLSVIRKRIQKARLKRNIRQEDVAEKLGISLRSYQRYESEETRKPFNPYVVTLRKVALAIGVDVGEVTKEPTAEELAAAKAPGRQQRVRKND